MKLSNIAWLKITPIMTIIKELAKDEIYKDNYIDEITSPSKILIWLLSEREVEDVQFSKDNE